MVTEGLGEHITILPAEGNGAQGDHSRRQSHQIFDVYVLTAPFVVVVRVQGGAHALVHDNRLANDTNRIGRAGKRGRSVEVGKRLWLVQTYHLMIHVQSGEGDMKLKAKYGHHVSHQSRVGVGKSACRIADGIQASPFARAKRNDQLRRNARRKDSIRILCSLC